MSESAVNSVVEALLADDELVLELSVVIGKAATKAGVAALSEADVAGVFGGLANAASLSMSKYFNKYFILHEEED